MQVMARSGTSLETVATAASDINFGVIRMDIRLHLTTSLMRIATDLAGRHHARTKTGYVKPS
jgi:hypothetical protein